MADHETTLALTGNMYVAQPISGYRDERFLKVVDFLRKADVTTTNLECTIQDGEDWPAYTAGMGAHATYMAGHPSLIDELKFLGINALCAGNNHVADFGENGILTMIKYLKRAWMPYAGIGASLTEASEACYYDTPSGARVAFMAACDYGPRGNMGLVFPWPHGYLPADNLPPFKSRPGVNLLRYDTAHVVSRDALDHLRQISQDLGWESEKLLRRHGGGSRSAPLIGATTNFGWEEETETELFFMGRKFMVGDKPTNVPFPYQEDLDRIYKHVQEARRQADIVVVALHDQSHGLGIHPYIDTFAHGVIDAGADVYFCNAGEHRGVEIYKGKALIYGQPSLFLQTEAVTHVPSSYMARVGAGADGLAADFLDVRAKAAAAARELGPGASEMQSSGGTAVHVCVFDQQFNLKEIRIQPLEPSAGPRFRRGLPLMPEPGSPISERVLNYSVEVSKTFGTPVEVRDGMGIIRLK